MAETIREQLAAILHAARAEAEKQADLANAVADQRPVTSADTQRWLKRDVEQVDRHVTAILAIVSGDR